MWTDWQDRDRRDDDGGADDESWSPALSFGDPDAWRGVAAEGVVEPWRGELHAEDWPEWDAGPEYLMWKRLADEE